MENHFTFWVVFAVVVSVMFYVDLLATEHRKGKVGIKTSLLWSGIWIGAALLFDLSVYLFMENGHAKAIEFLAGYIIEKSLSVDNLFVFIMIFNFMGIHEADQPHVLKWGILSAVVMRILFILAGVALVSLFHPVIYIFGILLFYASYKLAFHGNEQINLEHNPVFRFASQRFNLIAKYQGKKFFLRQNGKTYVTPLFLTLLLIESADLIFAVDSIPAVIAITKDVFVIITSNIFAILGLRALYFALAGIVNLFAYLKYGVAFILFFVGVKMVLSDLYAIPTEASLLFIVFCLAVSVILSLVFPGKKDPEV
ncbi:MAG: TerC/Alx family metal homeostasis membrane protein [Ignavibacteria bacterium]|jgi:tellurite resistance protein TerC|nr:TerC/Alx family metal homeostasis membrane protein [Ignavibacteria bacterium]MCU7501477.1 TerC/Alx family metal homeostasis membrane protein [Ignavibacteria bacterium]MCU7516007.1 TerC/Alx family metal homeostasis membrane protein [Ignavibacteria bacterium]